MELDILNIIKSTDNSSSVNYIIVFPENTSIMSIFFLSYPTAKTGPDCFIFNYYNSEDVGLKNLQQRGF